MIGYTPRVVFATEPPRVVQPMRLPFDTPVEAATPRGPRGQEVAAQGDEEVAPPGLGFGERGLGGRLAGCCRLDARLYGRDDGLGGSQMRFGLHLPQPGGGC